MHPVWWWRRWWWVVIMVPMGLWDELISVVSLPSLPLCFANKTDRSITILCNFNLVPRSMTTSTKRWICQTVIVNTQPFIVCLFVLADACQLRGAMRKSVSTVHDLPPTVVIKSCYHRQGFSQCCRR